MTFNRMGTVPLPLALHLASYTVLGLFCFFAGSLNLIDPVKIPHGLMFLAVCGFSWGYVFGILMARKEVVILGFLASAASTDVPRLHVLRGRGQLNHKPRTAELRVFDPDLPPDFGHDALANGEAKTRTFVGAFSGEKGIEDAAADLSGDARP